MMSHPSQILPTMKRSPTFLLDGGLGTTLEDRHSVQFGDHTPLWSSHLLLSDPATLLAAQTSFAEAGVDVILTATYQASIKGFAATSRLDGDGDAGYTADEAASYMRGAVTVARKAFGGRAGTVALSLGAYGATMVPSQEYSGKYDDGFRRVEALRAWHAERLRLFSAAADIWADVDLVAFETLPLADEVRAVRQAYGDACPGHAATATAAAKPFWISCVFPGEGSRLPDGSSVDEVARAMLGAAEGLAVPFAVGLNCTKIGKVRGLVQEFEGAIARLVARGDVAGWPSLVIYPDGAQGLVYNTETHLWEEKEVGEEGASVRSSPPFMGSWKLLTPPAQTR